MKLVSLLLCIITLHLINICIITSQSTTTLSQSESITILGYIYDHHPDINPNFEPNLGTLTKGIVKSKLNTTTRVPELVSLSPSSNSNRNGRIVKPDLFQYFFTSSVGQNIEIPFNLTLNYDRSRGVYSYSNLNFFPLDNIGYDSNKKYRKYTDDNNRYHNYHMCMKFNLQFKYNGNNEIFNYASDDDLWVYINNKLELDLGGIHEITTGSIELSRLGLTKNSNYPIDIFFCERHTSKSSIKIETNLFESCSWFDYCGVCNGDGSTCCNPEIDCNDNDKCTIDKCPIATTNIQSGRILDYCIHTPISIPISNDTCISNYCDSNTGKITSISSCPNRTNECLISTGCNSISGCQYKSKCSKCGKCSSDGTCLAKNQNDCGIELDGIPDPCMNYYCDLINGCTKKPKCSNPFDNKCQISKCRVNKSTSQGECYTELKPEIDDGDPCTFDDCHPCSGLITHQLSNKCKQCTSGCN